GERREVDPMRRSHPAPIPGSLAEAGRSVLKRPAIGAMMAGLSLVALAHSAFAACGDNPDDANTVAAARQAADSPCDCSTAKTHRRYVRCVAGAARAAVNSGTLSEECKAQLLACAARSTCGRPSAVRCCRTDASGVTHCQTVRRAAACRAPRGGSVCVSTTSTTEAQVQCCGSEGGAFVGECVAETTCDANHPYNFGPGSCSPNPCPLTTTTTAPGATTTTTTGAAPTTTIHAPPTTTTTSTTTTRPPTTTTTLRMCSGGVFPQCGRSWRGGKH